jgi:hypothetical protein
MQQHIFEKGAMTKQGSKHSFQQMMWEQQNFHIQKK